MNRTIFIALLAWFLWIPDQPGIDAGVTSTMTGKIRAKQSRGRSYISINDKNIFCSEGNFGGSTDCPAANQQKMLDKQECTAHFSKVKTKIYSDLDMLIELKCPSNIHGGFTQEALFQFRMDERDWFLKYFSIPLFIVAFVFTIFYKSQDQK